MKDVRKEEESQMDGFSYTFTSTQLEDLKDQVTDRLSWRKPIYVVATS